MITSKQPHRCLNCETSLTQCDLCELRDRYHGELDVLQDKHRGEIAALRDRHHADLGALKDVVAKVGNDLTETREILKCFSDGEQAFVRAESRLPGFSRPGNEAKWEMWLCGYDLSWDAAKLITIEALAKASAEEANRLREKLETAERDWKAEVASLSTRSNHWVQIEQQKTKAASEETQNLRERLILAQTFIADWTEWKDEGTRYADERFAALNPREDRK